MAAFGAAVKRGRERLGISQGELAGRLGCPQSKVSRLEAGRRSPGVPELLRLADALRVPVSGLLEDARAPGGSRRGVGEIVNEPCVPYRSVRPFMRSLESEEAALSQLAAHGARFLGGPVRSAIFRLDIEDAVLAALGHALDPRIFEVLPALVIRRAPELDWGRLCSGAFMLHLQNRLGMAVAAALQLRPAAPSVPRETWRLLEDVLARLAEARLDREEVLGPVPRTRAGMEHLARRTPAWLHAWHAGGCVAPESMLRHLAR